MSRPTSLSLFSGIGGLDLAIEAHGFEVVAQVENDPYCSAVLERHWPQVARYGDITEVDWHEFLEQHGPVDLVAAGFPCQPVSLAGRRKAQADPRWLWPEVARCLRVVRPEFVFLENTLGLLSRGLDTVLGDLAALLYDAVGDCFQAADVGAPHERDRVFILAYASSRGRPEGLELSPRERGASGHEPWLGGQPLADPGSARRRQDARGASGDEGQDAGRTTPDHHLANGHGEGHQPEEVADAAGNGCPGWRGGRRGEGQAGTDGPPPQPGWLGQPESGVDRGPPRISAGLDGHRWPAPPGPPYPWEPPRTVTGRGTVPYRGQRLKALGNAVVPQQGALAFGVLWRRMLEQV